MKKIVFLLALGSLVPIALVAGKFYFNQLSIMNYETAQKIIEQTENKSEIPQEVWRAYLDPLSYKVLFKHGTDPAFTGDLFFKILTIK